MIKTVIPSKNKLNSVMFLYPHNIYRKFRPSSEKRQNEDIKYLLLNLLRLALTEAIEGGFSTCTILISNLAIGVVVVVAVSVVGE